MSSTLRQGQLPHFSHTGISCTRILFSHIWGQRLLLNNPMTFYRSQKDQPGHAWPTGRTRMWNKTKALVQFHWGRQCTAGLRAKERKLALPLCYQFRSKELLQETFKSSFPKPQIFWTHGSIDYSLKADHGSGIPNDTSNSLHQGGQFRKVIKGLLLCFPPVLRSAADGRPVASSGHWDPPLELC